jgi:hypothetical protein
MAKNNRTADRVQAMLNLIGGDDVLDMLMDGRAKLTVEVLRRLTTLTSLTVASNTVNPHDFFKTSQGLWMSKKFNDFILSGAAKKKVSVDEETIGYADLAQAANDAEIGGDLPEGYVFEDVGTFLAHVATLIKSQWGGKSGALQSNGYTNIFYVKVSGEVFAVHVDWRAGDRGWTCSAYYLGGGRWLAGPRVFSATAA